MPHQSQGIERLAANPDVLGDAHGGQQVELLMDHGDARRERLARGAEAQRAAFEPQLAAIGRAHARDDLHQRRLAGAVLADERVHRAVPQA
jgi:hypothetical protein